MSGADASERRSRRILALLSMAEESPTADELAEYLTDRDAEVRRTALSVLSEAAEDWSDASPAFADALVDADPEVRERAADLLAELREVLVPGETFAASLRSASSHPVALVRLAAVGALWRHHLTSVHELRALLEDPEETVRSEAVLGLVSLDALDALDASAADASVKVRIATARAVAAIGDPRGVHLLVALCDDDDTIVRSVALTGMAVTGCADRAADLALAALGDPAWQVRQGAATALSVADPELAAGPLVRVATDGNLDVRKAAVRALAPWLPGRPEVQAALEHALIDPDADVRAYARMGLTAAVSEEA